MALFVSPPPAERSEEQKVHIQSLEAELGELQTAHEARAEELRLMTAQASAAASATSAVGVELSQLQQVGQS